MTYQDGWCSLSGLPQANNINTQNGVYGTLLSDIVLTGSFTHPVMARPLPGLYPG